jgi:hypothetical protein
MAVYKPTPTAGTGLHREDADDRTITGTDFKVPDVDMARAARFRPSRVKGKHVMWLVTFVSGMGVSSSDPWLTVRAIPRYRSDELLTSDHHVRL